MLRAAVDADRGMLKADSFGIVLARMRAATRTYPPELLKALEDYSPPENFVVIRSLSVSDLRESMILDDDVTTRDGNLLILQKGTVLNPIFIERVRNFERTRGIQLPVRVRVIRPGAGPL